MSRRKLRTEARIERMRQRISNAVANAQQFDTLIQQLESNHAALCSMAAVLEGKA
jgi:3-methyladenine DNA glycosylase Tag